MPACSRRRGRFSSTFSSWRPETATSWTVRRRKRARFSSGSPSTACAGRSRFKEEPLLMVTAAWGAPPSLPKGVLAYADPRLPALGIRLLLPSDASLAGLGCAMVAEADYHARRIALGVPEGGRDYGLWATPSRMRRCSTSSPASTSRKAVRRARRSSSRMEHRRHGAETHRRRGREGPAARVGHRDHRGRPRHRDARLGRRRLRARAAPPRSRRGGESGGPSLCARAR